MPVDERLLTFVLIFLAVFLLIVALWLLFRKKPSKVDERLESMAEGRSKRVGLSETSLMREAGGTGFGSVLAGALPEALGGEDVRVRLMRAGYRGNKALPLFVVLRVLCPILIGLLGFAYSYWTRADTTHMILYVMVFAAAGFFLPDIILWALVERRRTEIVLGLPDALDLMVICVEAGLGLTEAILRVGNETHRTCQPLSDELRMVNREMLAGVTRADALKNLAFRTGVEDIKSLVALLIQTERLGTSIAKSLRVHADNLRIRRRHRAEEKARKVSVKLVFPLVICIFPTLLVIILGPGIIRLVQTLADASR